MKISILIASLWLALQPSPANACTPKCQASDDGLALIRTFEGYMPFRYIDAAGHPTIGFGHLILPGETFDEPLMGEAAEKLLRKDVGRIEKGMARFIATTLAQHQHDALASFSFNLGVGALSKSTLLKRVNASRHDEVPEQFHRWVYAGGQKLRGLVLRRKAESIMYAD